MSSPLAIIPTPTPSMLRAARCWRRVTGTRTPRPRTALRRIPLHPARPPLRRRLPPTSTPLPARWTRPRRRRSLWHTPGSRRRTPPSPSPSWTMTMAVRCTKLNGTRTARSTTMRSTPPPARLSATTTTPRTTPRPRAPTPTQM